MRPNYESDDYKYYLNDQINDNVAPSYDVKYLDRLIGRYPKILDYANARVLDIGCRTFDSYDYFVNKFHNTNVTGVDVGKEGLEYCKKHKKPCIELDAHRLCEHFSDKSFDLIIAFHSFEHMYDLPHILRTCRALLSDEGYLYYAIPMPSHNWRRGRWYDIPTIGAMVEMCTKANLKTVHTEFLTAHTIRPENEMVGLAKPVVE